MFVILNRNFLNLFHFFSKFVSNTVIMQKFYLYILPLIFLVSCKSTSTNTTDQTSTTKLPFSELLVASHSNIEESKLLVIESKESLHSIYNTINKTRRPGYQTPKIDFEKYIVIGLFMGKRTTGGYSITIDHIQANNKEVIVYCKESKPKGVTTSIITQPCYIACIKKTNKPIRFKILNK